ncbi:MAG: restriction endonuclease subunit S [Metallibacterium scheffleri]|uniref:restriction endonuclease subunit S n=1 Tax=Metallibacterium scheffleri TaxID=993689 RepID=UPI0026F0D712|nr:restriction endonuclease subunit S [Metallibacterium scheffleri]MCK9366166.1 restriction endonuclease subunit S [Metallibacterium scheffleri]
MSLPRYPEYKDSGVRWLGKVPAHWYLTRLRRCVRLNPSKSEIGAMPRDLEVSFLPMEAIGDDGSLSLEREHPIQEVETGYTYFRDGDVAFAKITPCFENGKGALMAGLLRGVGFGTTELTVARPIPSLMSSAFLHWIFRSPSFRAEGEASMYGAGGQKRVPDDFVRELLWAVPPEPERERIATFLDRETTKIDALIAEQEKLLALLAEKRQASISHAVTRGLDPNAPMKDSGIPWLGEVPAHWRVTKCGRFLSVLSGYAFPSVGFDHNGDGTKLLRGVNISVGSLRWDDVVYWERSIDDGLDEYELQVGDLVIGMDRPLIAAGMRVAKVKEEDVPCLLLQRVALLRTSSELNSDLLMHWLSTPMFVAHFSPETTGVSVPHISPDQIASFVIALPPSDEQRKIIDFVDEELGRLTRLCWQSEQAVQLLKERRSALISAAVTGKIDVRETA